MSETVAEAIVSVLEAAGVRRCYGLPGDTLNHVTDAIRRNSIRFVHVRHEEVGGFAAGADAMLTGELAACAGSCGPGSLHFINGLYEAHRSRCPVVLIASQVVRDEIGFDFPQEVDFKAVYNASTVFCDGIARRRLPGAWPRWRPRRRSPKAASPSSSCRRKVSASPEPRLRRSRQRGVAEHCRLSCYQKST